MSELKTFLTGLASSVKQHKVAARAYANHLQSVASLAAKEEVERNAVFLEREAVATYQQLLTYLQETTHEDHSDLTITIDEATPELTQTLTRDRESPEREEEEGSIEDPPLRRVDSDSQEIEDSSPITELTSSIPPSHTHHSISARSDPGGSIPRDNPTTATTAPQSLPTNVSPLPHPLVTQPSIPNDCPSTLSNSITQTPHSFLYSITF